MMRRSLVVLTTLVLLMTSIGVVFAQDAGAAQGGARTGQGGRGGGMRGRMGGRGGGLGLLRRESVQKELQMSQFQIDKLNAKQQEVQGKMQALRQNGGDFQNMSPQDRQKLMGEMRAIQHQAVVDILDNTQMHRFNQLELQQQGASALRRKEIADKLQLSTQQRSEIDTILGQPRGGMRNGAQGGTNQGMSDADRQKMRQQMRDTRKAADEKALGVLNATQKRQWKAMQGKPFDFGPPGGGQRGSGA